MKKILTILFCVLTISVNAKPISIIGKDWDRESVTGKAFIIDGDTLKINGVKVRLVGVSEFQNPKEYRKQQRNRRK